MIKMGILNGYVRDSSMEKRCTEYTWSLQKADYWKNYFHAVKKPNSSEPKFEIKEISVFEIDIDYAIVLNPFGETYPEHDFETKASYQIIKTYIEDGGVLANTAGFPFVYAWDVTEEDPSHAKKDITELNLLLPTEFMIEGSMLKFWQLQKFMHFAGTLFYKEFKAVTTSDIQGHIGAQEEQAFQIQDDKEKFGDLLRGIISIKEFRAMGKQTPNAVPIIRSKCKTFGEGEVWPIAALKRGYGYILTAGMSMADEMHCELFARATNSFSEWLAKQYL